MGFLSKALRDQIMSPIGRPSPAMGVRPMLKEPGIDIIGERSIFGQPSPFGTPLSPQPIKQRPQAPRTGGIPVTGGGPLGSGILPIANLPTGPVAPPTNVPNYSGQPLIGETNPENALPPVVGKPALPPVDPRIIPQRPPSIGGIGGISAIPQPINNPPPSIQQLRPPITPPPLQRKPQPNLATGIIDPVSQPIQQLPQGPQPIPQVPNPFEKPMMPPNRDNFMSIGGPGGGVTDNRPIEQQPFVPPQQPTFTPISERTDIYGAGKDYDPANLPEGYTFDQSKVPARIRTAVMPPPGFVYAYGPDGDRISVPSGAPGAAELREQGAARDRAFADFQKTNPGEPFFGGLTPPPIPTPVPDPTITPPPTPPQNTNMMAELPPERIAEIGDPIPVTDPVVDPNVGPAPVTTPTDPSMPMGAIDPVLLQQSTSEVQTDPLLRSLYFGTADSPGFYNQLQQAGANLIGSDVPLQQTAGLAPLELLARQQAVAGLGGFEPFLQQNRDLVNQAIQQSRRAEQLQDPYYTQAEQIYQDTMGAYDPSMTQQFYNPYEDAVVQQTIEDVMKAGDKQDIAARAREISSGAFGGSRARLGAEERRQDLGEGLAKALSGIRQTGFSEAQRTGLGEFARQQQAKRTGAQGLMGIGVGRGSAASTLGSQLAGYGGQMTGLGRTQEELRRGQRGELAGFGSTGRGIAETGLGRIYQQQLGQQQRPLGVLGQIGSMLPGYQAASSKIDSQYGMPTDPTAAGLGAAFSAYGAVAPRPQPPRPQQGSG